ncbi:site-2 protease family protein [Saccharothrix deserti]|uniref:site-2 protease family protein n=1 Tax=Saccharothrix deserti TaxID=2593674 RepID=UPI00131EA17E|nr:site-2 protease family protein [Saccharothrix deserti]
MRATIHLGRLWGVRIGLHWSVFAVVVLLVFGVGLTRFPAAFPGHGAVAYLLAAVVAAVGFLLSLLSHELAHAVVARREGQRVEGITLWMLGGLAWLRDRARTPGADFRIAVAGPATSVAVAVLFGLLAWAVAAVGVAPLVSGVFAYLAFINFVLAAFNLIPAAPLDGGRILRAALWRRWGDRHRAALVSAGLGRGFGFALVLLGALGLLAGAGAGLWWVLVGVFVVVMASAERSQSDLVEALAGLRVRDVMTSHPDTADGDQSVAEFLRDVALVRRHSAFPLVDQAGQLQGLVTLNRLKAVPADLRDSTALRDIACPPADVPKVAPDDPLPEVVSVMNGCGDRRAPVFEHGVLVGIVSPSDISRATVLSGLGVGR